MPLIGDTIRLKSEFKDFDGEYVDPEDVKVVIYNSRYKEVEEYAPDRTALGKYHLDYTVPSGTTNTMYFEFKGTIGGKPVLGRSSFKRIWAK